MIDMTPHFATALRVSANYDLNRVTAALGPAAHAHQAAVDWSGQAGEEWARVLRETHALGYVWSHGPVAVGLRELVPILLDARLGDSVFVEVSSLDSPELSVDAVELEELLPGFRWPDDAVNPGAMTANELWWATV
jgi:hypothetical protein